MLMGLELLAAFSGLFCLLDICSSPDYWWLSVLSKWIYFSGPSYSSCLCCFLLLVMFGGRSQDSCWCCCPSPCHWVSTTRRAGWEDVQVEHGSNYISHSPENGLSTSDGQPLHSSSTFKVRSIYLIFSAATFIPWLAVEETNDTLRLNVELAAHMCLYKRNGITGLLFHSSSEFETIP